MNKDIVNILKLALLAVCILAIIGGTIIAWKGGYHLIAISVLITGVMVFIFWLKWFRKE